MMVPFLVSLAFGHGGEDHSAPSATTTTFDATAINVVASSSQFDAVFRVSRGPAGTPVATTLLLADFATSAPITAATPSLSLNGPGPVQLGLPEIAPGTYAGKATFPADGEYAGALVVTTPSGADLLSLSGLRLGEVAHDEPPATGLQLLGVLAGVAILSAAGLVAVAIGFVLGRRRGAAAALFLLGASVATREVSAHGGEDHSVPGASAAPDIAGALQLRIESQFLIGLRTTPLTVDTFQEHVPALGRFVARAGGSATLRAPISGELMFSKDGFPAPGSTVRAGQLLGTIRGAVGSEERAGLAESRQQAAMAVAEATKALALAERDASQLPALAFSLSERERLEREQSLDVARTALAEAERALTAIGDGVSVAVRAPVGGRLGPVLARPGDQVQAGDALFRVVDASGLWVEAQLPERLSSGVVPGATATIVAAAFPDTPLTGVILDAGQEANPATASLTVTLAVDVSAVESAGLDLHPGMSATAWLGRGPVRDVLTVPDAAVVDSNGMILGFIKVSPEQFELRELRLGARSGQNWEVLSGLQVGERAVVEGTYTLRSLAGR